MLRAMSTEEEKSGSELLSDYILNLSPQTKTGIVKDFRTINGKLSSSSWFSTKITPFHCIKTLELPFNQLAFRVSSFFIQQFATLHVPQEYSEKIAQSIRDKVKTVRELGSVKLIEPLSDTFYCDINAEWHSKSYIGVIIVGFVPSHSTEKIKLLCCAHCEIWQPSNLKKLKIQNSQTNMKLIQSYIIYKLMLKTGEQQSETNPEIGYFKPKPIGKKKKSKNPKISKDILNKFHSKITKKEVTNLLGLRCYPSYKMDNNGYIQFEKGLFIRNQFVLINTLGKGTFSKVFEAININNQQRCAIKFIRNEERVIRATKAELKILEYIKLNDKNKASNCIHMIADFEYKKHPCLVFKLFGMSLYQLMVKNRYKPFPNFIIRSFAFQICNALKFLHSLGIIYTDLKQDNIILVCDKLYPIKINNKKYLLPYNSKIKLIDFSTATFEPKYDQNNGKTFKYKNGYNYIIQTRHYRAPEVVLNIPWRKEVDIWSLGCVLLEFMYGTLIFITSCPIDHLNQMQKLIGALLPNELINLCHSHSNNKYKQLFDSNDNSLQLTKANISQYQSKRLDTYFNFDGQNEIENKYLYHLITKCLKWIDNERIEGNQLLEHEYFTFIKKQKLLTHKHSEIIQKQM